MRVILALMWAVILFGFCAAQEGHSAGRERRRTNSKSWSRTVEGLGLDLAHAKESALEKARDEITVRLRACRPPIKVWQPSTDFIQNSLVESAEAGKDLPLDPGAAKRWILHLKLPDWDLFYRLESEAQEVVRERRGEQRMLLLGKLLGSLLVLLMTAIVYVRVDDLTGGAYRRWLQVAAGGLVLAISTGLWMFS